MAIRKWALTTCMILALSVGVIGFSSSAQAADMLPDENSISNLEPTPSPTPTPEEVAFNPEPTPEALPQTGTSTAPLILLSIAFVVSAGLYFILPAKN